MEWLSGLCSILALLMELIVVPVCVVWLIITIVKKKDIKLPRNVLIGCVVAFIVFNGIGRATWVSPDDEVNTEDTSQDTLADADDSESETERDTQKDTSTQKDSETEAVAELSEEEYKAMCQEMYYSDIVLGDESLIGKKVKLYIEVSKLGKIDDATKEFNLIYEELDEKYHLKDLAFTAYVLDETYGLYSGHEIDVFFSEDYGLDAFDYDEGKEFVVYADIVHAVYIWDTYESLSIVPRYIEVK